MLQYGEWLGKPNGDWRKVEIALFDSDPLTRTAQQVMVLAIDYPAAPMLDQGMLGRLTNGERLVHLVDPRIPNRFKVWRLVKSWSSGTISVTGFLTAADRSRLFEAIFTALLAFVVCFEATITGMPANDRADLKGQMLNGRVCEAYGAYSVERNKEVDASVGVQTSVEGSGTGGKVRPPKRAAAARASTTPCAATPRPEDPIKYGKWAQHPENEAAVIASLKGDPLNAIPSKLSGLTSVELSGLQPPQVDEAVFART